MMMFRRFPCLVCIFLVVGLSVSASEIQELRDLVTRRIDLEKSLSGEMLAWKERETMLKDLIFLAEKSIQDIQNRIDEAQSASSAAGEKRLELTEQSQLLKSATEPVFGFLSKYEPEVAKLESRYPEPLRRLLKPEFLKLRDPQHGKKSISIRLQTLITILSEAAKFNNQLTAGSKLIALDDEQQIEIQTIYLGLDFGYYVSKDGKSAGVGFPQNNKWLWRPNPGIAQKVEKLFSIVRNTSHEIEFIELPLRNAVQGGGE